MSAAANGLLSSKNLRPDLYYVGLDIMAGGNNSVRSIANENHLSQPSAFDTTIRALGTFDAVISSHNIEHTEKPFEVLEAMCSVLRPEGACTWRSLQRSRSRCPTVRAR